MPQYAFLIHLRVNVTVTPSTHTHSFSWSRICIELSSAVCSLQSANVRHRQRYNKHLTNLVISVRTVSFFPSIYGPRASRLGHNYNREGKNSVRNLQYGPRTRFVRGIYALHM